MKHQTLVAFLGGVVVGGVVALLLAPESGEKTRRRIGKFVSDEKERLSDIMDEVSEGYEKVGEAVKPRRRTRTVNTR